MFNRKWIIVLLLVIAIFCISSVSASDLNATDDDLSVDVDSTTEDSLLESSDVIYFNASAASNGDGSKSNPYKYVNSDTLKGSQNNLTAYFAEGVYELNANFKINSPNIVLIGEGSEKTIFNSISTDKYDFEIMQNSYLELNNLTFNRANINNHGTFKADNVNFNSGEALQSESNQYGGVIVCDSNDFSAAVYINNCVFNNSMAYCGGAISLMNSNLIIKNSKFSNSKAKRLGGVIYATDSKINISGSDFEFNNAGYGGIVYCENTILDLKNSKIENSTSYSFGGAIASRHSYVNVDSCEFNHYESETDAGGAIYSFMDTVNIFNSSFVDGWAEFGGAIEILESNLTVLSSQFIYNWASGYGGSIGAIYSSINIKDSLFNRSDAFAGGAVYTRLSRALTFTNNIFLNCTESDGGAISIDNSNDDVVESGNYFENAYHVFAEYVYWSHNEKFTVTSKVLNYVVSSNGTYMNSYCFADSGTDGNEFFNLTVCDINFPGNSTVFGNFDDTFMYRHDLNKAGLFENDVKNDEYLHIYLFDDCYNLIYEHVVSWLQFSLESNETYRSNFKNRMISTSNNIYNTGSLKIPVSIINTTLSDFTDIPSAYDSRDYGYITPVKDQANGGNCWAFAGIATLEACIKKITNITYDFSEENAKNLMAAYSTLGLELDPNQGGYDSMLMGYLASWFGPVVEKDDVYDDLSSLSAAYYPVFYIQNIKFLPARKNSLDNDYFKKAIMDYGAVSVIFSWPGAGYHAVSLVGWDDKYRGYDSLGKYAKNGAWIFKNSWGAEWGEDGFGYLSYDVPFASDINDYCHAYTFIFNNKDEFICNYQYDYSGVSDYICHDGHIFYENKFTCQLSALRGFSTYFKYPTEYVVSVYQNDRLLLTQRGYSDAGYYTIWFNNFTLYPYWDYIPVDDGEFTIRIENCNSGENFIPVCQADELTLALFKPNSSFISYDGENWIDLYNLEDYTDFLYGGIKQDTHQVACIKVFGDMAGGKLVSTNFEVSRFDSVGLDEMISINVTATGSYDYTVEMIEGSLFTFNINGKYYYAQIHNGAACLNISFDKAGVYELSPYYENNLHHVICDSFNFTVNKKNSAVYVNALSKTYGGNEKLLVTLKDSNGKALSGKEIIVNLNGKSIKANTNSKGKVSIPVSLPPKTYTATVSFKGDGNYYGASKKVNVIVKKATPKLTAKKATFKVKKTKTYAITLKDSKGKAINKAKVTLKVNGRTFKATTKNGKATFKITNLKKKGTFTATVKYGGDKYYKSVSKKVKINVKK